MAPPGRYDPGGTWEAEQASAKQLAADYVGSSDAAAYGLRPVSDAMPAMAPPPAAAAAAPERPAWWKMAADFDPGGDIRKAMQPGPPKPREMASFERAPDAAEAAATTQGPGGGQQQAPAVAPVQTVGAAWNPGVHAVEIKRGVEVPDDAKYAAGAGSGLEQLGANQHRENAIKAGEAQADMAAAERGRAQLHAVDEDRRAQARDEAVTQTMDRLTQRSNELAAKSVDPDAYFKEKGTAGKVMSAVAVLFGNVAVAFGAKSNVALDNIKEAIDRNIKAQEDNLKNQRASFQDETNLFKQNLDAFGTPEKARAASHVAYLELGQKMLDERMAQLKTPEAEAAHADASAKIQKEIARYKTEFAKLEHDDVTETMNEKFVPAHTVGGGAGGAQIDPKLFVPTGANGEGYSARTEKEAIEARALGQAVASLENLANKSKVLREKTNWAERGIGNAGLQTKDYAALASEQAQAESATKTVEATGVMSPEELKGARHMIGEMTSITGNPGAALDAYIVNQKKKLANYERNQAGQGGQQQIRTTPGGGKVAVVEGQSSFASPRAGMPSGFKPVDPRNARPEEPNPQKQQEAVDGPAEPAWARMSKQHGKKK